MKKMMTVLCGIFALLMLASCGKAETKKETVIEKVAIHDGDGKKEVPFNPEKVVVFDNSALDTMNALGVSDRVVGAPTKNLPEFLSNYKEVPSAGGIKEPDLEKINAMQPDLIIISGRQRDFEKQLKEIAPTVYFDVDYDMPWRSIKHNIETLGLIFDQEAKAKKEINSIQEEINQLRSDVAEKHESTLVTLVNEGKLSVYGKNSRFGIIYDTFGFKLADDKIEASTHGQSISYEYILDKNPEIIFVVDRTQAIGGDTSKNHIADNTLVKETKAGKNHKVISLSSDVWYLAGSGIESLHLMIQDVRQAL